jgi:DNA recombination protein RmuC
MDVLGMAALGAALVVSALLLTRRRADGMALRALDALGSGMSQLQAEVARLGRAHEDLRRDVQGGREASLLHLTDTARDLRGEIGLAQRALAEVKAIEQARARQLEQAAGSLRRLEAVVAGSASRGAAGENILARALAQLPPDLLQANVAFGSRIVEYALCLPGGRLLPIDSKWTGAAALERLDGCEDVQERRRLAEQVGRELRSRVREVARYLDPERTLGLALLAVPDAVHAATPEAHGEAYRDGVLVVPYSLALSYALTLYRLALRFGGAVDGDQLAARVRALDEALRRAAEEVEGRLSRSLVQLENARDSLRLHVAEARRSTDRLLGTAVPGEAPGPEDLTAASIDGPGASA